MSKTRERESAFAEVVDLRGRGVEEYQGGFTVYTEELVFRRPV